MFGQISSREELASLAVSAVLAVTCGVLFVNAIHTTQRKVLCLLYHPPPTSEDVDMDMR